MESKGQTGDLVQRGRLVGPVLQPGSAADAIIAAIRDLNEQVSVTNRGSYWRVGVPERCVVTCRAIEFHLGQAFQLPGDLELLMPSFAGYLTIYNDEVVWTWRRGGGHAR